MPITYISLQDKYLNISPKESYDSETQTLQKGEVKGCFCVSLLSFCICSDFSQLLTQYSMLNFICVNLKVPLILQKLVTFIQLYFFIHCQHLNPVFSYAMLWSVHSTVFSVFKINSILSKNRSSLSLGMYGLTCFTNTSFLKFCYLIHQYILLT